MKVAMRRQVIKAEEVMDVCVDVHQVECMAFTEVGEHTYRETFRNRTVEIENVLKEFIKIARINGKRNVRVVCEPTGEYDRKLLRAAQRLGCLTSYVNAEAVSKYRFVETNDNNKTDSKDPCVIASLARNGKLISQRRLPEKWMVLRKLGKYYDDEDRFVVRLRNMIHRVIIELFCDMDMDKDFIYEKTGLALINLYAVNPYKIVSDGFDKFSQSMREAAPRIRTQTVEKLWNQAQSSVLNALPETVIMLQEKRFIELWNLWKLHNDRKKGIAEKMIEIMDQLRVEDPHIPEPVNNVINAKNLARLLAETGPLSDFSHWRGIMRYSGLNICMKQSGKYQGKYKISKKGRYLMRKVLSQIVLPIVRHDKIYGKYYHQKKDSEKLPGNKAMTIVARQFLRKFFGWYKAGQQFDQNRFFTCLSRYEKAA